MPQRRATSPAQSSFNVFPTSQPSKAAEMLGTQNFSRRPGPLVRANTLPIDSPSKKLPPPPHHAATMGSISSFESPVIPKLFSESSGIPRTASGYDKPLPAIKPEPEPEPVELQQSHMPKSNATSPQNIKPQQSVQALDIVVSSPEPQPDQSQENVRPQNDKLRSLNVSSQENVKAQAGAVAKPDSQPTELQKDVHKPTQAPQETHSQQTVEPQHVATSQTEEQPSRSQQGVRPQKNTPSPQRVRPQANIQTHSNGIVKAEPQPIESRKNVRPQKGTAPLGNMPPRQSSLSHKIVGTAPSKPRQPVFQPRKDSLPQTTQSQAHAPLPPPKNPQRQHNKQMGDHTPNHPSRPRLRVQTQGRPHPPTKDTPSSSTLLSASSRSHSTPDRIDRIMTPLSASTGPKSGISPADSTRMPFVDAVETLDNAKEEPQPEPEAERPIPKVEVSIARSVSVSRAKRQIIVPIGERIDHLDPDERFVQRRPMTPQITDAHRGHRPGVSQDVRIECL